MQACHVQVQDLLLSVCCAVLGALYAEASVFIHACTRYMHKPVRWNIAAPRCSQMHACIFEHDVAVLPADLLPVSMIFHPLMTDCMTALVTASSVF